MNSHGGNHIRTVQVHEAPTSDAKPSDLIPLKNEIRRIARALEAANASRPVHDDSGKRSADAEENGAKWAFWMFVVACFETAVTGLGVYLVWHTLNASWAAAKEAKRAADAAEKSIKVTRNVGRAQVRAYVGINAATMEIDETSEEGNPVISIVAKNTGQSPAHNFLWTPTVQFIVGTDKRLERRLLKQKHDDPGTRIVSSQEIRQSELIGDMSLDAFAQMRPAVSRVYIRVRIEYEFTDVFKSRIVDEAYFDGLFDKISRESVGLLLAGGPNWRGELNPITKPNNWALAGRAK